MIENRIKTVLFLGVLSGLLLLVGQLVGGFQGLTFAFVMAIVMNVGSFFFSHKLVLLMYGAKPADKMTYAHLHSMVSDVAHRARVPVPSVYIVQSATPNAFATGPTQSKAVIAFTTGILSTLNDNELRGVTAHEMSHIQHRDMLITTIAATIASVIGYVAFAARWAALFGGFGGRDNERGGNNIVGLLVLVVLVPIMATLLQLAISRSREYLADEKAARLLKDKEGLANALLKLENGVAHHPMRSGSESTSSMFIVNPFRGSSLLTLLSTHPSTESRVARLKELRF